MKINFQQLLGSFVALAILITNGASAFSQSEPLKWDLKKDQQFDVALVQNSKSVTKVDARQTTVENSTSIQFIWNILKVNGTGEATIEQSIAGIKLSVSNPAIPAQAVKFDTAASDEEAKSYSKGSKTLLKQIKPLIGLKFNVVLAPSGEIKSVELPKATSNALEQLPGSVNLRKLFSPSEIKTLLGSAAIVLPDSALKDGDSWSDEKKVQTAFGDFTRKRTYKFTGEKTDSGTTFAQFEVVPEMIPISTETDDESGSSLKGKLISMTGSGKLMFDVKGGYLQSSFFENSLSTERPYREKNIQTVVTNEIQMNVTKK